jgi:hypothetical protein
VRLHALVLVAFLTLTALVTYPQVTHLGTSVPYHSDPYFSMWRLGWVSHELLRRPWHLFEANIFFPAHDTFLYSDAMLLPGAVLAPLFWMGVSPVVIYNSTLLGAMALSGLAAFVLARRLTGSVPAGIVAGAIYAFAPYRFDHYLHLELQLVFWLPIALIAVHRIVAGARIRDGLMLGGAMVGQALSSLYAAIFFTAYCAVFVPVLLLSTAPRRWWRVVPPLLVATSLTVAVVTPYALAYVRATRSVGTRSPDDVGHYGASIANYLAAPPMNRLYGSTTASLATDELYLFPGAAAIVLALIGVVAPTSRLRLAYATALVAAFELSRGLDGATYGWLYRHLPPFQALRSPARIGILVNLSLSVLAAFAVAWLLTKVRSRWRLAIAPAIVLVLVVEYASAPALSRAPAPTLVDSWLAQQPPVVIVQLPLASPDTSWQSRDWVYMYQGLAHRQRMLNGYSGYAPASYYAMLEAMRSFPDDRSLAYLRDQQVDYVVLRGGSYSPDRWSRLLTEIQERRDLSFAGGFPDGRQLELVYGVER